MSLNIDNLNYQNDIISNIPILLAYKDNIKKSSSKGCVLFYHGLGAAKDKQLKELNSIADNGFLAIGIDNVGHGEREYCDFEERFSDKNPDKIKNIYNAVKETALEINQLINGLTKKKYLINNKLGIVGISMGAFISYEVPLHTDKIKTIVAILGSPIWKNLPDNSDLKLKKYSSLSLLSQNAGKDIWVPAVGSKEFHDKLKEEYNDYAKSFKYVEYPESGHFMEENDWNECWSETLKWLDKKI